MKNMNMISYALGKNTKKMNMFLRKIMKGTKKNFEIQKFILIVLSNVAFFKIKLLTWHF